MTDGFSELQVQPGGGARRLSFVWMVPVLALLIAVGVAWQNYANQGVLIEVAFPSANGVHADETELRYRDIAVGQVEEVRFSDALDQVIVSIRVDQEIAPFVDQQAQFWLVRPEVTTQGVTGLDTVLSGVYIEGDWDGEAGVPASQFEALAKAPLLSGGQKGTIIKLSSSTGLPPTATPILFRGVRVGQIGEATIGGDGQTIVADAVIFSPHDQLISSTTRFWDVSGISFSLGAAGATVDFSSLASLLAGGVAFETLGSGGVSIEDGREFSLFADEQAARQSFLIDNETGGVEFLAIFDQNLPGLRVGSAVQLGGLQIGEVTTIAGVTDEARFGDGRVRLLTTLRLVPSRIGFNGGDDAEDDAAFVDFIERRVNEGLRARLANVALLTNELQVDLFLAPDADPAALDRSADPFPQIPTTAPNVTDVTTTVQDLLQRIDDLPVEEVMASVIDFLDASTTLVSSEETQAIPGEVAETLAELRKTVASTRALVESEEIGALPGEIAALSASLQDTANRINAIVADIEEKALVAQLTETIAAVGAAADTVPGLAKQASSVLSEAEKLSLQDLATRAEELISAAEAVLNQDSARALPEELNATLTELRSTLASLREGGLVENANATLASARGAAEAVSKATESLPELSARLNRLAGQAGAAVDNFSRDGDAGRELSATLRQIEAAAAALERLARQISRNPNSILIGR
ncbi:MlaD family protein [Vannielia litorea]|uniref:MlaD family protein n=1 Tax=Vannielia litorea TaxID=1217970 RepID=UPI001BCF4DAB|nr:MlaD family protein [Vannielia litorea]MBS8225147.1 MCE family protein [Vannielia litorea]